MTVHCSGVSSLCENPAIIYSSKNRASTGKNILHLIILCALKKKSWGNSKMCLNAKSSENLIIICLSAKNNPLPSDPSDSDFSQRSLAQEGAPVTSSNLREKDMGVVKQGYFVLNRATISFLVTKRSCQPIIQKHSLKWK